MKCDNSTGYLSRQPELASLRKLILLQLYSGTYDGGRHLPAQLPTDPQQLSAAMERLGLDDLISVLPGGCLVGVPVWAGDDSESGYLQVSVKCLYLLP